jgi:hypothetical protein
MTTFKVWMAKVDALIEAKYGVTTADLIDHCYDDWFEDGMTAAAAAKKAVRLENGGEE